MFAIRISRAADAPIERSLEGTLILGRDPGCDIRLEDGQVSRRHASLEAGPEGCVLRDRGSMNGTFLYGNRLEPDQPTRLQLGQCFTIGEFTLELVSEMAQTLLDFSSPAAGLAFDRRLLLAHLDDNGQPVEAWREGSRELLVCGVHDESPNLRTIRLAGRPRLRFDYAPGQSIPITVPLPGGTITRSFPISSSPSRPYLLELALEHGCGDETADRLAEHLVTGRTVNALPPEGDFDSFSAPASHLLLLAEGAGLAPLLSMLRWVTDVAAPIDIAILVEAESAETIPFRSELEALAAEHPNVRLTLCTRIGGRDSEFGVVEGFLDAERIATNAQHIPDREVFVSGSPEFLGRLEGALDSLGSPRSRRHLQSTSSPLPAATPPLPNDSPSRVIAPDRPSLPNPPSDRALQARESVAVSNLEKPRPNPSPIPPRRAGSSPVQPERSGRGSIWPFARTS